VNGLHKFCLSYQPINHLRIKFTWKCWDEKLAGGLTRNAYSQSGGKRPLGEVRVRGRMNLKWTVGKWSIFKLLWGGDEEL